MANERPTGRLPARIGPYEVVGVLGQGGMGTVYRGRAADGAERAVKVLSSGGTEARSTRFEREAALLESVRHPNVVAIHDRGVTSDGRSWFAMDLVEGEPLDKVLERGPLPLARALDVVAQVARGVGALHEKGVIHRDLKPQNVVLAADGRPIVLDLGLAIAPDLHERLTRTGAIVGTPRYMAPEQLEGRPATPATDVHALGLLLHEAVTGEVAFPGETAADIAARVLRRERPCPSEGQPDLPAALDRLVARATALSPAARFPDADALADALVALGVRPGPSARARRRMLLAALVAAIALSAGLGAGLALAVVSSGAQPRLGDPSATVAPAPSSSSPGGPGPRAGPSPFSLESLVGRASVEARAMRAPLRILDPDDEPDEPREVRAEFLGPDRIVTYGLVRGDVALWSTADLRRPLWVGVAGKLLEPAIAYVSTRDPSSARLASCAGAGLPGARIGKAGLEDLGPLPGIAARLWPDVLAHAGEGLFVGADASGSAVIDPTTGGVTERFALPQRSRAAVTCVAASPRHVAIGITGLYGEQSAYVWVFDRGAPSSAPRRIAIALAWTPTVLAFSPVSPDTLAVGRYEGYLHVIEDVRREDLGDEAVRTFASPDVPRSAFVYLSSAHPSDVRGLVWSPDGTRMYTASYERETGTDPELRAWDVRSGRLLAVAKGLARGPAGLARSPDGRLLLLGTHAGAVELWLAPDAP